MTFLELLDELKIPYRQHGEHHHVTSGFIGLDCPYCSKGWGHFRLGYNLRSGYLSCWSCGGVRLHHAISLLADRSEYEIRKLFKGIERGLAPEIKARGELVVPHGVSDLDERHALYLKRRGLNPDEIVANWKVQGIGVHPKLPWRLFIPVHFKGQVVSWTTRSIMDVKSRYLSASPKEERINLKHLLYGEDKAENAVIVVEGPIDVWKIGAGAVCTFGTSYTTKQVMRLSRFSKRAIWFDNEKAAQDKAQKLVDTLEGLPGETYLIKSDYKDPGDAPMKEINAVRKQILW